MGLLDRLFGSRSRAAAYPPVIVTCTLPQDLARDGHRLLAKCAALVSDGVVDEFKLKRRQVNTNINAPSSVVFTVQGSELDSARVSRFVSEYWGEWTSRARSMGVEAVLAMRKL